jgi:hypothetical protein
MKIKIVIIIVLKHVLWVNLWQGLNVRSRVQLGLTRVKVRIKSVIIIILKLDLEIDQGKA